MHKGSCLCGAVTYQIDGELGPILLCHCAHCRKANAGAFNVAAPVATANYHVLTGQESLAEHESSPGVYRVFCRGCGSPLFSKRDAMPETLRVRLGTLDTPVPGRPTAHIFTA